MPKMTLTELTALLRACAGEEEGVDLDGDILDVPFTDLGYDSLAVLQTTGLIERELGISLDDEAVAEAATPKALLELVNGSPTAVS